MSTASLARYAWLSIAAALATIALKALAWWLTGSVGLLSDAMESLVNLAAALVALAMLTVAARPPDEDHAFGHGKAEYFASGLEGLLILLAAAAIVVAAAERLARPRPLAAVDVGLAVSALASAINWAVARILISVGKRARSVTLEADGQHLMTDVWTSAGVIAGVAAGAATGWERADPVIALVVAGYIVWTGISLIRRSAAGLMDTGLPPDQHAAVLAVLERHRGEGLDFHALRARQSGVRAFVSVHVLVPGRWTVASGHEKAERIEAEIRAVLPRAVVFTHLEPLEDPVSWHDVELDRT